MNANFHLIKTVIILLFASSIFIGCSKEENNSSQKSHKLVFKVEASAGSIINMSTFGYDGTVTTISNINNQTWTSTEITAPADAKVATITANARGADASATLKVQIIVDGVLKKEGTSTGTALVATAQHTL